MLDYERVGMVVLGWWADWWLLFPRMWEMLPLLLLLCFLGCLYGLCPGCGLMVYFYVLSDGSLVSGCSPFPLFLGEMLSDFCLI